MLEELRKDFQKLIALYENEKHRADVLAERLGKLEEDNKVYREQITDLNRQIENLRMTGAFCGGGDTVAAKESISRLIREIDKCIKILEK